MSTGPCQFGHRTRHCPGGEWYCTGDVELEGEEGDVRRREEGGGK